MWEANSISSSSKILNFNMPSMIGFLVLKEGSFPDGEWKDKTVDKIYVPVCRLCIEHCISIINF